MATPENSAAPIVIYQAADGSIATEVRLEGDTVWLSQKQMAELFDKDVRTINEHIIYAFEEGELMREATIRNFRIVRQEGQRQVEREVFAAQSAPPENRRRAENQRQRVSGDRAAGGAKQSRTKTIDDSSDQESNSWLRRGS